MDQISSGPRSKTGDIRTEYMDGDGPSEEDGSKVKMGNDMLTLILSFEYE